MSYRGNSSRSGGWLYNQSIALLVRFYSFLRNFDKATEIIRTALDKWPEDIALLGLAQEVYDVSFNWDGFFDIYKQLENVHPNKVQIKLNFGSALLTSSRYEDALPKLIFVVKNWDLDATYFRNLANVYARLAICYGYLGEWELLAGALQEAERIGNWDPDMAYGRLLLYFGTNSEKVLDFLDEQINKYPKLYALYYWKGLYIQNHLFDNSRSVQWYESALEKMSDSGLINQDQNSFLSIQYYASPWEVLKQGVDACIRSNNTSRALSLIHDNRFHIKQDAVDTKTLMIYSDILNKLFDSAERECAIMLQKNLCSGNKIDYLLLLAQAQLNQNKGEEALSNANRALVLNRNNYEAWRILAEIQIQKKDWTSALKSCQTMIRMNRFDFRAWEFLGFCYINIGDTPSAKDSYEKVVQQNPFHANAWIDLGKIYLKLGDKDLALSAFQRGCEYEWVDKDRRQQAYDAIKELTRA
ncbi:MAG TPA: tetratricopeptide repeat protein [Stenomitos sp.]